MCIYITNPRIIWLFSFWFYRIIYDDANVEYASISVSTTIAIHAGECPTKIERQPNPSLSSTQLFLAHEKPNKKCESRQFVLHLNFFV